MKLIIRVMALAIVTSITFSCKKEEPKIVDTETTETVDVSKDSKLIKLGEVFLSGAAAKAIVYATKEVETGYNEIYVALYDSVDGSRLSRGHFDILPIMDMGSMQHSSPVENSEDTLTTDGYFKSAVIFSMAGNSSQWSLQLFFHNHKNEKAGNGKINLAVKASSPSRLVSTVLAKDNSATVYVSLVGLGAPAVGMNEIEVVLHKKVSMMEYNPIDDYTIEIEPTMPSMGHGSPNNVNPKLDENGHYKGKVNFTMSGLWRIKLKLYKDGVLLSDDQYFEMTISS